MIFIYFYFFFFWGEEEAAGFFAFFKDLKGVGAGARRFLMVVVVLGLAADLAADLVVGLPEEGTEVPFFTRPLAEPGTRGRRPFPERPRL